MKTLLFAVCLAVPAVALADDDLKPAQEEAKAKFDEETADSLKAMNEKCGTKATLKSDFKNFKDADWSGISYPSYCTAVLDAIGGMCADRPAYKKVIGKKLTSVSCLFSGAKAAAKDENFNEAAQKNMSFKGGAFTFTMAKDTANIGDNTKAVMEKALN